MNENKDIINTSNLSTKYGVLAGICIGAILFLFQIAGNDFAPALKLAALLPLAIFLFITFKNAKDSGKDVFPSGIGMGLKLSLISAITVVAINLVFYLINNSISFSKYSILPETGENFLMICVILLFEIFVFGGLISFILMQSFKNNKVD